MVLEKIYSMWSFVPQKGDRIGFAYSPIPLPLSGTRNNISVQSKYLVIGVEWRTWVPPDATLSRNGRLRVSEVDEIPYRGTQCALTCLQAKVSYSVKDISNRSRVSQAGAAEILVDVEF